MTDTADGRERDVLREVLARLDDLTDRVTRLEAAGPPRGTGVSSLDTASGDYDDGQSEL
jgi:hypothetical protein